MREYLPLYHPRPSRARGAGLRALILVAGGWVIVRSLFIISDDGAVKLRPMPPFVPRMADPLAAGNDAAAIATLHLPKSPIKLPMGGIQGADGSAPPSGYRPSPDVAQRTFWGWERTAMSGDISMVDRDYMGQLGPLFLFEPKGRRLSSASREQGGKESGGDVATALPFWIPSKPADIAARPAFGLYAAVLVRPNAGYSAPFTSYGGSQLYLRTQWRLGDDGLARRSTAYARVNQDLSRGGRAEYALGVAVQPMAQIPVIAHAERRFRQGAPDATATFISGGVSAVKLPLNAQLDGYAQGGRIWPDKGKATSFFDGQARVTMPLQQTPKWQADVGVAVIGGGEDRLARLDIGPVVHVATKQDQAVIEGQLGWRFRVAGDATPASGPAVTLSFGF